MNLTLHLIGSEFRYLRLFLSVWWGLVILQAVLIGSHPQLFSGGRPWLISPTFLAMLVAILKLCLLTVIVSQAVQKDSTVGSTAFWLSRPIFKGRLLASKALFLVLAVVLPTLLVEVVSLRVCGVTQDDTLRSIPTDGFPATIGHPRSHDAGGFDPQPSQTDLIGDHRRRRSAPAVVYFVVSFCSGDGSRD